MLLTPACFSISPVRVLPNHCPCLLCRTPQVKKTWSKNGAGFTYGLCTAAFFIMCPFLLLTGIVLTGNKHHTSTFEASPQWTKSCEPLPPALAD